MAVGFCLVVSGRPDGGMNSPSQWAQQKGAELLIHMYVDNMCIYIIVYTHMTYVYTCMYLYIIIYIHAYIRIYIYILEYYTQYIHHMYPKLRGG